MSSPLRINLIGDVTPLIGRIFDGVADLNGGELEIEIDPDSPLLVSHDRFKDVALPAEVLYSEWRSLQTPEPNPFPCANDKVLYMDTETHNAGKQWSMSPREFFRLGQYAWGIDGDVHLTTDYDEMMDLIASAEGVVAHNGHNFDWSTLYGQDSMTPLFMARDRKLLDTMVWANLAFPAPESYTDRAGHTYRGVSKPEQIKRWLSLDNLAFQFGIEGKHGDLKELAKKHTPEGTKVADLDYGLIPVDDPEFVGYARQDIVALQGITRRLCLVSPMTDYDWREQLCAGLNAQITRNGFMVDTGLAQGRVNQLAKRREEIMNRLVAEYDFPTEGKSPWASNAGKDAIVRIFADYGITPETHIWPRTPKGALKLGGDELKKLAEGTDAEEIANALAEIKGQRSLAQLTLDNTQPDSKVHPDIDDLQRSGRSCLPETHHLLTRRGVVPVDDVRPGEDETIDHRGNWVKVLDVHRYQNAPVIRYENERVMIESTPEHRWVQWTESRGSREIKPLKRGERRSLQLAPDAYPFDPFEMNLWSHMTPRERTAALVGFLVTDGHASNRTDAKAGRFVVYQTENKFYRKIREFLGDLVTSDYSRPVVKHPQNTIHEMRLKTAEVENILRGENLDWTGGLRNNESLFRWVLTLSRSEVEAFLTAVYISDGNSVFGGSTQIANSNPNKIDTIQYAVYRMGRRSNYREYERPTNHALYGRVAILRDRVSVRKLPEPTEYIADVWCVTTETGTFTAWVPDGKWRGPYLTGNSITRPGLTVWNARGGNAVEKSYYVAEPGCKLVSFDLSNADARAVAAYSQDGAYRENFLPGVDNHMNVARMVYGDRPDFVNDKNHPDGAKYRQLAKACIAEGSLVLTDRGLVPIEKVTTDVRVWDGEEFVKHEGMVYRGVKEVITYDGITATPDHRVFTEEGLEIPLGQAAEMGLRIDTTGIGREPIRARGNYVKYGAHSEEVGRPHNHVRPSGLSVLPPGGVDRLEQSETRENKRVQTMHVCGEETHIPELVGETLIGDETAVRESREPAIRELRGARDYVRLGNRPGSRGVDTRERPEFGSKFAIRPDRQRQGVRSGEHSDGYGHREHGKSEKYDSAPLRPVRVAVLSEHSKTEIEIWNDPRRDHRKRENDSLGEGVPLATGPTKTRVYDIVNAGPNHRFTANGKLVANCSHAWNYGGGAKTISRAAGVPESTAQHFVDRMSRAFPKVVAWRNRMATMGERDGYIENKWGRRMPVVREQSYTQSSALMGQSGTREIMKDALIKMLNYDPRLIGWVKVPVHDELIFSIPESELAWAVPKIEELMYYEWDGVEFYASHGAPANDWEKAGH